jgi:P27 family predicted phage terminase small subunit
MTTLGRRPEPTRLKLIKGNPGKKALNLNEPELPAGIPEPPVELCSRARKEWVVFANIIDSMGVMTIGDGHALARMCEIYAELIRVEQYLRDEGCVVESVTRDGGILYRARPEVGIRSDCETKFKAYLQEFGLTPSSRTKIQVPSGSKKKDSDPISRFFN